MRVLTSLVRCRFAFLIAVGYPMFVLLYCMNSFEFNREMHAINEAVFPLGAFERGARVVADPVGMEYVLKSLNSLRIVSATDFFTRMGTNLSLCFQFTILATRRHRLKQSNSSLYPYRHPIAILFALLPVAVIFYVSQSIWTSRLACAPHPECVGHAFRWISLREGDKAQCPCLTLIDVHVAPRTYALWRQPPSVMDKLAQLATSGDLQTVQITNRLLPTLPDELRRCTNLKHL